LDGLRGVAALLVVLLHVEWSNHLTNNKFVQNGYVAVDLFFILSGFVIASNYSHRITNFREARSFIGLRFFRLYPLHLTMLCAFICLEYAKLFAQRTFALMPGAQAPFTGGDSFGAAVANLFLLNGLHALNRPSWNGASWSISCEFAAYLVFSVLVLAGLVRSRLFFVGGTLMAVTGYVGLAFERGNLNITVDWGIIRCLAGFFLGMLIFRFRETDIPCRSRMVTDAFGIAAMIAAVLTMSLTSGPFIVLVIPIFVIGIAFLQTDQGALARFLISSPMQFLGRISYSIYMVHSFLVVCLLIVLKRLFVLPSAVNSMRENPIVMVNLWVGDLLVLGTVALVVATASATYAFVEEPGRLFGRGIFASSQNPGPTPASPRLIRSNHPPAEVNLDIAGRPDRRFSP